MMRATLCSDGRALVTMDGRFRCYVLDGERYPPGVRAPEPLSHPLIVTLQGPTRARPHAYVSDCAGCAAILVAEAVGDDDLDITESQYVAAAASLLASNHIEGEL